MDKLNEKPFEKDLIRTWNTGQSSCTLIIPKKLAKEYGIDEPSHLIIEKTTDGILLKKFAL